MIRLMHERTAEVAIGASTLRNQGAPGVVLAARQFLKKLNLDSFRNITKQQFQARLNTATKRLRDRLPRKARNWGAARKAVNIFLRDALSSDGGAERVAAAPGILRPVVERKDS